jgi:DNA-binding IclR family transcriptional regulator
MSAPTSRIANNQRVSGAQSIERAFGILRFIAGSGSQGARLIEVVRQTGLARPTVHRILQVLEQEGAVLRAPQGKRYVIGPELALLGLSTALRELRSAASPFLRRLCDEVGDAVFLSVASGLDTVCADRKIGAFPIQVLSIDIGSRRPLGVSVNGMAILSRLKEQKTEEILNANVERFAAYNVPLETVAERVRLARERGYVHVEAALVKNTRAVAVPILSSAGAPVAAVSTIAISRRIPAQRLPTLVSLLRATAEDISQSLHQAAIRRR